MPSSSSSAAKGADKDDGITLNNGVPDAEHLEWDRPALECGLLLRLPAEEAEWARHPVTLRMLMSCDALALAYSLAINGVVMPRMHQWARPGASTLATVMPALVLVFYLATTCWQLAFLARRPAAYAAARQRINGVNRALRLAISASASAAYIGPAEVHTFAECLNKRVHPLLEHLAVLRVLRPYGPVLIALAAHANWVLPFRFALPLQLATFGVALKISASLVCWYATVPGMLALAQQACASLDRVARAGHTLFVGPLSGLRMSDPGGAGVCSEGLPAVAVLLLYSNCAALVLLPCAALYQLELSSKSRFAHATRRRLSRQPLSWALGGMLLQACMTATWFACKQAVALVPFSCNAEGGVVLGV